MTPLALPATCILAVSEVVLESTGTGWLESSHLEVMAESRCPQVDVLLPDGAEIITLNARIHLSDGGRQKLRGPRLEGLPRALDGTGGVRVHTPDLLAGDAVWIELVRALPAQPYTWDPTAGRGRFASLEADETFVWNGSPVKSAWVRDAAGSSPVVVAHPSPVARTAVSPATGRAVVELELVVPGDPQRSLYPGGGSSVETTWTVHLDPGETPTGVVIQVPPDARDLVVEGTHDRFPDAVRLRTPSPQPHMVAWVEPDAPTHGDRAELPGLTIEQRISTPGGRIGWEDGRYWWLGSIDLDLLTPDHRQLLRALDQRFRRAALPEPAVPVGLRNQPLSAELVDALRAELAGRAGVADLPLDPLFPRRLVRARKDGALTSLETALILTLQLGQLEARATWALVDPGPPEHASWSTPVGYTEGLVVLSTPGGLRFIDPACSVCAAFEVRPHLEGTRMLSPAGFEGPPVTTGTARVTDTGPTRTVRLEGPAALELRLALSAAAKDDRTRLLTERFGGPGATFGSSTGLANPGMPVTLTLSRGPEPPGLLAMFPPTWPGPRILESEGEVPDLHLHRGDLCLTRRSAEATRREILTVNDVHLAPDAWSEFVRDLNPPKE